MELSWSSFFGGKQASGAPYLPTVFPLSITQSVFVEHDIESTYQKILTDVMERVHGLDEDLIPLLFDNCLKSEASQGLISLVSCALSKKSEIFLVYNQATGILREATPEEKLKIRADYLKSAKSSVGVYVSFDKFFRTDMVRFYSELEFCAINALNKQINLSTAVQYKISNLRGGVSMVDQAAAEGQAEKIATALKNGKDIMLDADDIVELVKFDMTAIQAAFDYLESKRCFYLGMPKSYFSGDQTTGIGTTGEADSKSTERGLKNYYFSIIKPLLEALFGVTGITFKSQDFRMIDSAMLTLKTFEITSERFLGAEAKKLIMEKLLDIDPEDNDVSEEKIVDQIPAGPNAQDPGAGKKDQAPTDGKAYN